MLEKYESWRKAKGTIIIPGENIRWKEIELRSPNIQREPHRGSDWLVFTSTRKDLEKWA